MAQRLAATRSGSHAATASPALSGQNNPGLSTDTFSTADSVHTQDDSVVDTVYECQRGLHLLGVPMFSAKMLNPIDLPPWSTENNKLSLTDVNLYQLPDPLWQWTSDNWQIDMSGNVDEDGWQYATTFQSARWHGANKRPWKAFVRRRKWVRQRRLLTQSTDEDADASVGSSGVDSIDFSSVLELAHQMHSDRERLQVLKEYFGTKGFVLPTVPEVAELLGYFIFDLSRHRAVELIAEAGIFSASMLRSFLEQLDYYSLVRSATPPQGRLLRSQRRRAYSAVSTPTVARSFSHSSTSVAHAVQTSPPPPWHPLRRSSIINALAPLQRRSSPRVLTNHA
jgi:hypothetical protein